MEFWSGVLEWSSGVESNFGTAKKKFMLLESSCDVCMCVRARAHAHACICVV